MGSKTAAPTTAYDGVMMLPIAYFWKTCGAFSVDLSYNGFEKWFSAAVFASGVLNVAITPWSVCLLDGWCEDSVSTAYRRMYTRTMACTSIMSRAAVVYKLRKHLSDFKRREDAYERKWPLSEPRRRRFRAYASTVVTACLVLMVPINAVRLYLLYKHEEYGNALLLMFFFNVYLQNWSMCCMETHFALLCFAAYLKFQSINDELSAVRTDVMIANRYPVALRTVRPNGSSRSRRGGGRDDGGVASDDESARADGKRGGTAASVLQDPHGRPLETALEVLRVRHGLTRDSIDQLNDIFGGQLALSLITLCVMTLFDVYNEAFSVSGVVSRSKFIYGWLLQYLFRFFVIVITAHNTTQEGYKSKVLVTEINNRHLNDNTKYELQLFLKQMNHQSIDITACDCFSLNRRLVASAIAVGTTYLFVLIQFRAELA